MAGGTTAAGSDPQAGFVQADSPALVLASASATRRALLHAAGLRFEAMATSIDEAAVKHAAWAQTHDAADTALLLARLKAGAVSRPGALVVGCDQILVCDGAWFDKPPTLAAARDQLLALRGRRHRLATATCVLRDGVELWRDLSAPVLSMRRFTDAFLDAYLAVGGDQLLGSVGAYQLEGLGVHLFDAVEGEHSAILGLPMPPLLSFLRDVGVVGT